MAELKPWIDWLPSIGFVLLVIVSLFSAAHALLHNPRPRAALVWVILCLGWPGVGALVYWVMGVNRIETRARKLGTRWPGQTGVSESLDPDTGLDGSASLPEGTHGLARISYAVTRNPLLGGNRVTPLENGEAAYPAMLDAIASARRFVFLSTYIMDNDATGARFADTLSAAVARGVDVRVLLDGIGERYSLRRMGRVLRRRGINVGRFLPPSLRPPGIQINLRNHRKLLVIDGRIAFTGGMNIGDRHLVRGRPERKVVKDLHFEIEGPVVEEMERTFLEDWGFVTGSPYELRSPGNPSAGGSALCRAINDGPNEDIGKLKWILLGAISTARERIRIMTPYFLPDPELTAAICAAALRGVNVEVILPQRNNLPYVAWACNAHLWQLLSFGVRVYYQPGPFVHTKLLLIDDHYAQIGSANLDPRSLRLNFEFNLEVYCDETAAGLIRHFDAARELSRELSESDLNTRPSLVKVRDGLASLLSPYL